MAGEEARHEHPEHMPLDRPGRFGIAEAAIAHRDRACRHHQVHHAVGDGGGNHRHDEARLPQDFTERTARSGSHCHAIVGNIEKAQHRHRRGAQHGHRGIASGKGDGRQKIGGPDDEQRSKDCRRHAAKCGQNLRHS